MQEQDQLKSTSFLQESSTLPKMRRSFVLVTLVTIAQVCLNLACLLFVVKKTSPDQNIQICSKICGLGCVTRALVQA